MIDKEKLMENWDELKDETKTKILVLADKEIKEDYFVPKVGEEYYYYALTVPKNEIEAYSEPYMDIALDKSFISLGNCFSTKEEAIFAGNCDYYTKRFETYVNRHTVKLDWKDGNQEKFCICYSYEYGLEYVGNSYISKAQGTIYASSQEILEDAIADIGEENFLKYVMK